MSNPYEFKASPVKVPAIAEPKLGDKPEASSALTPIRNEASLMLATLANLRQAAVTASRNEIPVDQSDMRGW